MIVIGNDQIGYWIYVTFLSTSFSAKFKFLFFTQVARMHLQLSTVFGGCIFRPHMGKLQLRSHSGHETLRIYVNSKKVIKQLYFFNCCCILIVLSLKS